MFSGGDANMMLAAVISLLVVLTFVILLHCYARWFLSQDYYNHHRMRHRIPPSSQITGFLHNPLSMLTIINTEIGDDRRRRPDNSPNKGLESSAISSIPQFVYKVDGEVPGLECIVCLSSFENEEKGRKLQLCEHSFHVDCIDMWLHSHSTCPICRAPAVCAAAKDAIVVEDCDSTWSGSLEIV